MRTSHVFVLVNLLSTVGFAQAPPDSPRPIPLTRPEMKQLLEDMKFREPRIPLPELTDKERENLDGRSGGYESRLRYHYLDRGDQDSSRRSATSGAADRNPASSPTGRLGGGFSRSSDPKMTLDNGFKVELFWIVSRTNNCQYCLGHQESKLLGANRSEDRIAALDGDWSEFTPAEKAAYAFARKFTYEPHLFNDEDIVRLQEHYSNDQILEMMLSMAWNNSINRWKEGVGVPQSQGEGGYSRLARLGRGKGESQAQELPHGSYLTPTSARFEEKVTIVAPIHFDESTGEPTTAVVSKRPELESRDEVEQQLERCRERTSRLPLVDMETTRKLMSLDGQSEQEVPNWLRLMAHFPEDGVRRAQSVLSADSNADLNLLLKAQLSWITARNDRAWYAVGQAQRRLTELGQNDEQIYALDGDWSQFSPSEQSLFVVAKNLAASPVVLTDAQVKEAVELAGPAAVVQTVNYVTHRAAFNRLTEAAGLPLE